MECERAIANWLNDAYNAEQAIEQTLESFLEEAEDEELRNRVEAQIEETAHQAEKLKKRMEELDREPLPVESEIVTWLNSAGSIDFENEEDRLVRFALIKYSLKYLERALIKAIATAAEQCNDEKTIELCQNILGKELETAEILDQELYGVVTDFINRQVPEKEDINWDEGQF